jgi:hypothetical protein
MAMETETQRSKPPRDKSSVAQAAHVPPAAFSGPDKNPRYNKTLKFSELFPTKNDGTCACGCGRKYEWKPGRFSKWYSEECTRKTLHEYWILKGDVQYIRKQLQERDGGICAHCKKKAIEWQADHIIAVVNGGGGCGLENYQTLCTACHKKKTRIDVRHARRDHSQQELQLNA